MAAWTTNYEAGLVRLGRVVVEERQVRVVLDAGEVDVALGSEPQAPCAL